MKTNLLPIAKEGFSYIAYSIGFFIVFSILDLQFLELIALVFLVFFTIIFRNPEREVSSFEKDSVLSPVDGTIVSIDELDGEEYSYKIKINTSYQDLGVLRIPMDASVASVLQVKGTRISIDDNLSHKLNEHTSLVFEDKNANKIKVVHTLKQGFCSIGVDISTDTQVRQSSRYGLMIHGITEIYLPQNFRLNVSSNDELKASISLLGYFSS